MSSEDKNFFWEKAPSQQATSDMINRLFDVAHTDTVFSAPYTTGDYTIITASEVMVSMGAGYGGGSNLSENNEDNEGLSHSGYGGGGGGGGLSLGRPVAAISIGPGGLHVEPIVDPTKISIALFTTLAAMLITLLNVLRFQKSKKLVSIQVENLWYK